MTANEIQGLLENDDNPDRAVDVILLPPADDALSDEDSDLEEDVLPKDPNHLGRGVLTMQAELTYFDVEDELPDLELVNEEGETVEEIQDETADPRPGPSGLQQARGGRPPKRPRVIVGQQEGDNEVEDSGPGEPEQLFRYIRIICDAVINCHIYFLTYCTYYSTVSCKYVLRIK